MNRRYDGLGAPLNCRERLLLVFSVSVPFDFFPPDPNQFDCRTVREVSIMGTAKGLGLLTSVGKEMKIGGGGGGRDSSSSVSDPSVLHA